jgi:hypothetical protein
MKYHGKANSEIRDFSKFSCDGFHLNVEDGKSFSPYMKTQTIPETKDQQSVIPDDENRALYYVFRVSGGELTEEQTYHTVPKFVKHDAFSFSAVGLPSSDYDLFYDSVLARYVNPGKDPELFDVTVDFVTGDGTILQSWLYSKCAMISWMPYMSDNWAFLRDTGKLVPEIREKSTYDCAGSHLNIDGKEPFSIYVDLFKRGGLEFEPTIPIPPKHQQEKYGVSPYEVECKRELHLMIRPGTGLSHCILPTSLEQLQERGWELISLASEDPPKDAQKIGDKLIPAEEKRAASYTVSFVGREIADEISFTTFSSFMPYTPNSNNIPSPQIQDVLTDVVIPSEYGTNQNIIGDKPHFVLESLPAKDKKIFYDFISRYVNPGKTPELFDALIEILDGNGESIESWVYRGCEVTYYGPFFDNSLLLLKYHGSWLSEYRDKTVFECIGLHVNEL